MFFLMEDKNSFSLLMFLFFLGVFLGVIVCLACVNKQMHKHVTFVFIHSMLDLMNTGKSQKLTETISLIWKYYFDTVWRSINFVITAFKFCMIHLVMLAGKYSQCGEKWRLAVKSLILLTFPISGKLLFFYHRETQSAYASLNCQIEKN